MNFKTITSFNSTLGGEAWRATSNGEAVNIQKRPGSTWRTVHSMSRKEYDAYVDHVGLDNPYNDDPGLLACFERDQWN